MNLGTVDGMNRVAAFFLAPIPAAAIGGLISWATHGHPRPVSVAIFYLLALYALQLIFGLAIYSWLARTGRRSLLSFASGGLAMVAIVAVPYLLWASAGPANTTGRAGVVLILWLVLGAITGATAWLILQWRQQAPPNTS